MQVLITGATGFVGAALARRLVAGPESGGPRVRAALRRRSPLLSSRILQYPVGELSERTDWRDAVRGTEAVVHCAARVHVQEDQGSASLAAFRATNVDGTLHLARSAAAAGVRRFVFLSSIKVHGESTSPGSRLRCDGPLLARDAYGLSKLEAETGLRRIAERSGMELVIIRPPLVHGPGAGGNFATMVRWLQRGLPLPLGSLHNQRSLVGLDNLVDLVVTCLTHPAAAGEVFLVCDGEDVSTTQLLRRLGHALGCPARLFPVPGAWLALAAAAVGRPGLAQRLCGSLQVDAGRTCELLDWRPPLTLDEGLARAAKGYLREENP